MNTSSGLYSTNRQQLECVSCVHFCVCMQTCLLTVTQTYLNATVPTGVYCIATSYIYIFIWTLTSIRMWLSLLFYLRSEFLFITPVVQYSVHVIPPSLDASLWLDESVCTLNSPLLSVQFNEMHKHCVQACTHKT